ncbi:MAG: outer membrane beta-barrel protein [Deltaproteobacteria bacterium]|nr:outer membrane beta-barrel protein [Deltaproteobacteria bacterium]
MVSRWLCSVFWIQFCLCLGCFIVLPVRAAEYVITPSVKVRETYDDNVYFRNVDDFKHLISPALKLDGRTDRARWQATCAWDITEYQYHDELDSVDQTYRLSATVSPSTLLQLNISGHYVDDYTFASTLEESGLLAERSRRSSATMQPGAVFILDSRNTLEFSYEFNKSRYELESYPGYVVHGLNLMWFHNLTNERTRIIYVLSGNQTDFKGNKDYYFEEDDGNFAQKKANVRQRTYRFLTGMDHQLTETFRVSVKAGAHFTEAEFPSFQWIAYDLASDTFIMVYDIEKKSDTGFILDGALTWHLELITLSASINRDVTPSIYGENITRDRVSAALRYRLSEKLRCSLNTAYYHSKTESFTQKQEYQTYSIRPALIYRFTENINLELSYAYTRTKNEITDQSEDRNCFFVQLSTAWPSTID